MSKNIIITGTSSGIGFELVNIFSKKNHRVLALSRDKSKLRELKLDGVDAIDFDLNHTIIDKVISLKFKPALQNGIPVKVRYKLPIVFQ